MRPHNKRQRVNKNEKKTVTKKNAQVVFSSSDDESPERVESPLQSKLNELREKRRRKDAIILAPDTPELDRKKPKLHHIKKLQKIQIVPESDDDMPTIARRIKLI